MRWHMLTSKPRGSAVYRSTGENWLRSDDAVGLYCCTGAGSSSLSPSLASDLSHAGRGINDISVRCATGFIFPQSWPSLRQ